MKAMPLSCHGNSITLVIHQRQRFLNPFSFAQIENHYVKHSFHQILEPLQFTIPLTLFCLTSSFNRSLVILAFQETI